MPGADGDLDGAALKGLDALAEGTLAPSGRQLRASLSAEPLMFRRVLWILPFRGSLRPSRPRSNTTRRIKMKTRTLAIACSAALLALPLSGAHAGQLTELAKVTLKVNGLLAKQALTVAKNSVKLNARATICAAKIVAKRPC